MIKDRNIALKTKKEFHRVQDMQGCLNGTFEGTGGVVLGACSVSASEQVVVLGGANVD